MIQAAAPIFTVLLAARLDPSQACAESRLVGVGVGFARRRAARRRPGGRQLVGALAVIGTALCYAVSVLYAGARCGGCRRSRSRSASSRRAGADGAVRLAQAPGELPPARALAAIAALGALGSGLAYLLYFALIASAGASRAILVTYLVPAFALVYGAVLSTSRSRARRSPGLPRSSPARRSRRAPAGALLPRS